MRRIVLRVVLALATLFGIFLPVFSYEADQSVELDPARFTDYSAVFDVDDTGTLEAVETLTAEMPQGRHGIFRFFDVSDPSDSKVRLVPEDIEVTLDEEPVDVDLSWRNGHRFRVVKIGDGDRYVSAGSHVYEISYRIQGTIAPPSAGQSSDNVSNDAADDAANSVFYWNLVPQGWGMPIARSTLTVNLPEAASTVQCAVGAAESGCKAVAGEGTRTLTVKTGALDPRTPVTLRAGLPLDAPERVTLPWSVQYDEVFGRSLVVAVILGLLGLVGLFLGWFWDRRTREDDPGFPVLYEPPAGTGPVTAAYITEEKLPKHALVATLLYQAQQGLTELTSSDDGAWMIKGTASPEKWAGTDPATRAVGKALGVDKARRRFKSDGSVEAGKKLQETTEKMKAATSSWATDNKLVRSAAAEVTTMLVVGASIVVAAVLMFWNPFGATFAALSFAGVAIGGVGILRAGVGSRRTTEGRAIWSRAGGFRRLLSTSSGQERFDFSARKDAYTAFIPWAVGFDCADAWAKKYRVTMNENPPAPSYLYDANTALAAGAAGGSVASMVDSFESSVSSSIGAYASSQSSSSSGGGGGGGGFSGGGGGGGGGGGSW